MIAGANEPTRHMALALTVLGVALAAGYGLIQQLFIHNHLFAGQFALHVLSWPTSSAAQLVAGLGAVALLVSAVASRGWTASGNWEAYTATVGGVMVGAAALPLAIIAVFYLLALLVTIMFGLLLTVVSILFIVGLISTALS